MKLTPWEVEGIVDYSKLIKDFGIEEFSKVIDKISDPHHLMKRGVIFGHRDYERIINAMNSKSEFIVMSGFMPSGYPHLGHKMTMDEIIWHNDKGGYAFVAIADMEAHAVRGLSWNKTKEIGMEYIKALIALGLKKNSLIYFQSANQSVKDLAYILAEEVNWSELKAIYGFNSETTLAKMFSTSIQSADILAPQLSQFKGPKPTVVPVGADQDPHIRLTRDLSYRVNVFSLERVDEVVRIRSRKGRDYLDKIEEMLEFKYKRYDEHIDVYEDFEKVEKLVRDVELSIGGYAFIPPSSTYHKFITGLTGGKMSSSKPESFISLLDDPKEARKKVMRALTGGRATAEEQKRYGGIPERCAVFELYMIHLIKNDDELDEIEERCRSGKILCGECKRMAGDMIENFLKELQEKMDSVDLNSYEILM